MPYDPALSDALKRIGGPVALARKLGIVPSAVTQWTRVPPRHVLAIEGITGITRYKLRPDIFGPAPPTEAQSNYQEISPLTD